MAEPQIKMGLISVLVGCLGMIRLLLALCTSCQAGPIETALLDVGQD